jgi:TRAP-type uncharacterized transport system fused permease subunit
VSDFQLGKLFMIHLTGLPRDALHIYVGLGVLLLVAFVSRRSLGHPLPILAVLLVALSGELWDLIDTFRAGKPLAWGKSWHDLWNTLFWPTALFLLARFTRVLKR